jgi:hypothetical protein
MSQADGTARPDAWDTGGDVTDREVYHDYSVDDEDQPQDTRDSLVDARGLPEPLDEGYSPPEKWSAGQRYGNTPLEESLGETLDQRVVQEISEGDPYVEAEDAPYSPDDEEYLQDDQVGDIRAGRLVAPDEGVLLDVEKDMVARDVGIDGAAASAEEAAMHVIPDGPGDSLYPPPMSAD